MWAMRRDRRAFVLAWLLVAAQVTTVSAGAPRDRGSGDWANNQGGDTPTYSWGGDWGGSQWGGSQWGGSEWGGSEWSGAAGSEGHGGWSWTHVADPRELNKGSIKGAGKDTGKGKAKGGDTPASRSGPRPEGSAGASSSTAGPQASRSGPRPEGSAGASSSSAGPQASHSGPRPEGSATRHVEGSALGKREVTIAGNDGM
jgi:hypothetical protein